MQIIRVRHPENVGYAFRKHWQEMEDFVAEEAAEELVTEERRRGRRGRRRESESVMPMLLLSRLQAGFSQ